MRVVVLGATGNVGTSVLSALAEREEVEEIVGVARRTPQHVFAKTRFVAADVTTADLVSAMRGADAVVHLAWLIQPSRDQRQVQLVNKLGSQRVMRAVAEAGVPALIYASSVGAYSPAGDDDRRVTEGWPTRGIRTSFYSRHKAWVERALDHLEAEQPQLRVVRMRPALSFKAAAASEIWRLFIGVVPPLLVRRSLMPVVPDMPGLRFQVVHSHDVGDAFARAVISREARGAFNLASEPVLDAPALAKLFRARLLPTSPELARAAVAAAYRAHLAPVEEGWLDLLLHAPLMDSSRARRELGWAPAHEARETLTELIDGIGSRRELDTPPLARTSGPVAVSR